MADAFDVKSIWESVERVATGGEDFTTGERELVDWLQSHLGLRRSPERYARRTRQRYQSASREGLTAREINMREYQERRARKRGEKPPQRPGVSRSKELNRLIGRRNQLLPEAPVDRDEVDTYANFFGEENMIFMLTNQIESCLEYQKGNSRPGNRRWYNRTFIAPVNPDFTTYIVNTDIFFFYHSGR